MTLLWSDRGETQARASLRQALTELRRAVDGAGLSPLVVARDAVRLDRDSASVDVAAFERALAEGTPQALARAAELYGGPLLDGFPDVDTAFEAWLREERTRLADRARDGLMRLLEHQRKAGKTADAVATATPTPGATTTSSLPSLRW